MSLGQALVPEWGWGSGPFVEEDEHRRLVWLMAEFFQTVGFTELKARLPGFSTPELLAGTIENHRPDLTCFQNDAGQTRLIAEIVTPRSFWRPEIENRWSLLGSAARLYGAELHFVVRAWRRGGPLEGPLKLRLAQIDLSAQHIWTV